MREPREIAAFSPARPGGWGGGRYKLASLVLPVIGREFGAGPAELGDALAASSLGMLAAFLVMRVADRVGRRPVFLASVAGYAPLTLATAFVQSPASFTALQLVARLLMVVELSLAYLILSEELPPDARGRANGLLGAFARAGARPRSPRAPAPRRRDRAARRPKSPRQPGRAASSGASSSGSAPRMMDRVGRRPAAAGYLVLAALVTAACFQSDDARAITAAY